MRNTKMSMKYKVALTVLTLSLAVTGCATDTNTKEVVKVDKVLEGSDEVVAVVNGISITDDELMKYLNRYKKGIVENLIDEKIEQIASESLGVEVTEEDIEEGYNNYVNAIGEGEAFEEFLAENSTTEEGLKHNIAGMLLRERTIEKIKEKIDISEEDLKELYEANPDQYKNVDAMEVIVIKGTDLDKVKASLNAGKTGEEIEKEFGESIVVVRLIEEITSSLGDLGKELSASPKGKVVVPEISVEAAEVSEEIALYRVESVRETYEDVKEHIVGQQKEILKYKEYEKLITETKESAEIEYK